LGERCEAFFSLGLFLFKLRSASDSRFVPLRMDGNSRYSYSIPACWGPSWDTSLFIGQNIEGGGVTLLKGGSIPSEHFPTCGEKTLAGSKYFRISEIEVFEVK
jgi:hypothetical protein